MRFRHFESAARALIATAVATSFMAFSQPASAATAYGTPTQQLSAQTITDFTNNPGALLNQFPEGGGQMISRLRDLLASDSTTLTAILGLVDKANKEQKQAIASALAQAAKLYARVDQQFVQQIQQAVANTQDQELIVAYAAAAGDVPIGGVGGGASGGGVGGQTSSLGGAGAGGGGIEGINGNGVNTGPFSFTGSASGGGSATSSVLNSGI